VTKAAANISRDGQRRQSDGEGDGGEASSSLAVPAPAHVLRLASGEKPMLVVVIDTEEEFDWYGGFDRNATSVEAIREIERLQSVFDAFSIRPTYVVDYPVATQEQSVRVLRKIHDSGRGDIGAHQHPWVCPPFDEEPTAAHSFPGNLPRELEAAKLERLCGAIENAFGLRPRVYKAGRHGIGPNTASILAEQGFELDLSSRPAFDLSEKGGPDFSRHPPEPYWLSREHGILTLPETGAFLGPARRQGAFLMERSRHPMLRRIRFQGILARTGVLDRLMLSPEGFDERHHRRLTRDLYGRGVRTFMFSMHSTTLRPGCTPYTQTEAEVQAFLDRCRSYFEFFLSELGGVATTPLELRQTLLAKASLHTV
jgi:hypothetical protein